jgi:hypothetical protein
VLAAAFMEGSNVLYANEVEDGDFKEGECPESFGVVLPPVELAHLATLGDSLCAFKIAEYSGDRFLCVLRVCAGGDESAGEVEGFLVRGTNAGALGRKATSGCCSETELGRAEVGREACSCDPCCGEEGGDGGGLSAERTCL